MTDDEEFGRVLEAISEIAFGYFVKRQRLTRTMCMDTARKAMVEIGYGWQPGESA